MVKTSIAGYMRELREAGFTEKQVEVLARNFQQVIAFIEQSKPALNDKERSAKSDDRESELRLQKEIEGVRKETAYAKNKALLLVGAFGVFFFGVLAKGFHWF